MRIAYDYQIFGWQKYGGISRYIYELAFQIALQKKQEVRIVSPLYINQYLKKSSKDLQVLGWFFPSIPKFGRILRAINFLLAWPIVRWLKPNIFHETYYSKKTIAPQNSKIVLTVYDMIHERFRDQFSLLNSTVKEKAIAVNRADHVICISEQTRQDLIELLGVQPAKISVVHLGFSLTCDPGSIKKLDSYNRPFLLYVGARFGYKNFESLVKAYAESIYLKKNFDLICFGGGRFSNSESNMIQHLSLDFNKVRQVSGDDEVLAGYYLAATAFVYPSLYEGFGIPPLEAMSFDCPVICSNVSSIPEVVGNAAVMFNPNDIKSIKSAIERVVKDENLQSKLIRLGRRRVKLFTWARCANETLKIYRKVLS